MTYPTSIENANYFGDAYNNLSTTLTQLAGISDTTIYVSSTTNFPSVGWITIEDEVISYTGTTTGSFTGCTRGADGTTAAEHAAANQVSLTLTAAMWDRVVTELRAVMTKIGITGAFNFVDTSTAQTIAGIKTFSDIPVMSSGIKAKEREVTIASSATPTPNADTTDIYTITALAEAATFGAPTGTPTQGQALLIRIKDNATARALSWNAIYRAIAGIPTTTRVSKTLYIGFVYNSTDSKWDCMGSKEQP